MSKVLTEGPRDERGFSLLQEMTPSQGNKELTGTNCSAHSTVTETAGYKLTSLNAKGNNISSESSDTTKVFIKKK